MIYQIYLCGEILKYYCPVTIKGNELHYQKRCDFLQKVDELQRSFKQQGLDYPLSTVCKIVAESAAPRFYVSTPVAFQEYNLYLKGKSAIRTDVRRRMYAEIFSRYEHLVKIAEASGQRVYKQRIMQQVLDQEAPSFYYTDESAYLIYYYFMKKKRKRIRL